MTPLVTRLLFVLLCLTVPIVWGIFVNALFRKFRRSDRDSSKQKSDTPDDDSDDDAVIEYYI